MSSLPVSEIFGPTIQGEGMNTGLPVHFMRLGGCNLACSWCDTPYTWDWERFDRSKEIERMSFEQILHVLRDASPRRLVITGGEPMLHQRPLKELVHLLRGRGWYTEIETAGTIVPEDRNLVDHWTISPKLANSGNDAAKRYNPEAIDELQKTVSHAFKFVVSSVEDFDEIDSLVNRHFLWPVYVMPEGISHEAITKHTREIINQAIQRDYRVSTRLHVSIWGNVRGV